jgi:hypothetical protein
MVEPSLCKELVIALAYAEANLLPCNSGNFLDTLFCKVLMEALVSTQ